MELQNKINIKGQEIEKIEAEIEKYEKEIAKTTKESKTLKNQIYQLQSTANKLKSEINLTNKQIDATGLSIEKLGIEIENKNNQIKTSKDSLAEILRELNEEEAQTLLEILLKHDSLSEFFSNLEQMDYLQKDINVGLEELKELKETYEEKQSQKRQEKNNLETLTVKLGDQKQIAENNKKNKNYLLTVTKNKESNYKKLRNEQLEKKEAFERELQSLEAELRIEIDPNSLPSVGSGVLTWPMSDPSPKSCWDGGGGAKNCITQFFGNTPFATKNSQIYNGSGHTGLDFRASVGMEVKAASGGVIKGVGNTDAVKGCYSYGKWVLIEHRNGLSTLYAHLSLIKVSEGQSVATGQVIGYSGATGYATGPHLHFTVYATQGVKITKFTHSINCKNAIVPIADKKAYLNPLSYL